MSQPAFVPERHEIWYTDGSSGFYAVRVSDTVWPAGGGAPGGPSGGACTARTQSRHRSVRRGARYSLRATLTSAGERVVGATVRLRAPGVTRQATTDSRGRVTFKVRPRRKGHATVSTTACGGRLALSAKRLR
jgi:hypothetical protein